MSKGKSSIFEMKIAKHQLIWFAIFSSFLFIVYFSIGVPKSFSFSLTNLAINIICIYGMISNASHTFSLKKITFIFFLFFFGISPLYTYNNNIIFWDGKLLDSQAFFIANILTLFGLYFFIIGSKVKIRIIEHFLHTTMDFLFSQKNLIKPQNKTYIAMFLLTILSSLAILYNFDFNINRLLFRGLSDDFSSKSTEHLEYNQTQALIFSNFIRPIPIIIVLFLFYFLSIYPKKTIIKIFLVPSLIIALLVVFPTSLPRYSVAALYIPFFILALPIFYIRYSMQLFFLFSLLIIFPFLEKFRNFSFENFNYTLNYDFLKEGHFDAYQNFARIIDAELVTNGKQLLGAIFFFIPRNYWPEKAIGSGHFLAFQENLSYSNISMPFIGEGYINFGIPGLIIFMLFLGYILNFLDSYFWKLKKINKKSSYYIYYAILFGFIFFMLRGDLMSSFAYLVGTTISFFFLMIIFNITGKQRIYNKSN